MKKIFFICLISCLFSTINAQETTEQVETLSASELIFQLNTQVYGHNHHGENFSLMGIGAYFGYAYFIKSNHRISAGLELTYRNGLQLLLIPDYHYEWIFGKYFRTALGMKLLGGYCSGMGGTIGAQPSFEFGFLISSKFSISISTGYRFVYYSKPSTSEALQFGKNVFEIPIELNLRF